MATYVTSDAHGHVRALDAALNATAPGADDTVFVLGDMIDRGPDPLGVIRLVRSIPGVRVLMGNHERMMLDALLGGDIGDVDTWDMNGGWSTSAQLSSESRETLVDILEWFQQLPLYEIAPCAERTFILTHAGIDPERACTDLRAAGIDLEDGRGAASATPEQLIHMLALQKPDDLLWIRGPFWGGSTGLVGKDGSGPVVVCGHTPVLSLAHYAYDLVNPGLSEELGHGVVVPVGACEETGGVADRIDIDCGAATGSEFGAVGVMRLEDGATWYGRVNEWE